MSFPTVDLASEYTWGNSVPAKNYTAAFNGVGVDFRDCSETVEVLVNIGLVESDTTVTVKLQESADNSTFTDISGATTAALSTANSVTAAHFRGRAERYVRAVATTDGASDDINVSVTIGAKKKAW